MLVKQTMMLTASLIYLTSCTAVGPDYKPSVFDTAKGWFTSENTNELIDQTQPVDTQWWKQFNDPQLTSLIKKTINYNLDIKIAESHIRENRALRSISGSGHYPDISLDATARREGLSENAGLPAGQVAGIPINRDFYDTAFDASWELDLWGKTQRSIEAADARLDSATTQRNDIVLTALAETARNYVELRGAQKRVKITEKNITLQRKTLNIIQQRYDVGDASKLDVVRTEAQLRNTESLLPNQTADIRIAAYRIALLTGDEPQALLDELLEAKPLSLLLDVVPVGLRSDILRRRPDVRIAERNLAAETADIGVVTANLFPSFSLTGSAGIQSLSFGDLFQSGSTTFALGPSIQWPVFKGGEIRARIKVEEAQAEAASLQYEKAVLSSLNDVEASLVRYGEALETYRHLQKAEKINRKAVALAKQSFEVGESNVLAVVDADRELTQTKDNLVQSETRTLTNLIALYKALGGGWEIDE